MLASETIRIQWAFCNRKILWFSCSVLLCSAGTVSGAKCADFIVELNLKTDRKLMLIIKDAKRKLIGLIVIIEVRRICFCRVKRIYWYTAWKAWACPKQIGSFSLKYRPTEHKLISIWYGGLLNVHTFQTDHVFVFQFDVILCCHLVVKEKKTVDPALHRITFRTLEMEKKVNYDMCDRRCRYVQI